MACAGCCQVTPEVFWLDAPFQKASIQEMLLTQGICSGLSPSSLCDMKSFLSSTSLAQFRFIISGAWRELFPAVTCSAGFQLMAPLSFQDPC